MAGLLGAQIQDVHKNHKSKMSTTTMKRIFSRLGAFALAILSPWGAGLGSSGTSALGAALGPSVWEWPDIGQQAYLKASNPGRAHWFGFGVAISGDTVVVGATGEDSGATGVNGNEADNSVPGAGAAYVFVRSGTNWSQQAYLKASNPMLSASFGLPV